MAMQTIRAGLTESHQRTATPNKEQEERKNGERFIMGAKVLNKYYKSCTKN